MFLLFLRLYECGLSQFSDTSADRFTAAADSWTVIIEQRGREEEALTGEGMLINTQRQRQESGRIIRQRDTDSYLGIRWMGGKTSGQIARVSE